MHPAHENTLITSTFKLKYTLLPCWQKLKWKFKNHKLMSAYHSIKYFSAMQMFYKRSVRVSQHLQKKKRKRIIIWIEQVSAYSLKISGQKNYFRIKQIHMQHSSKSLTQPAAV